MFAFVIRRKMDFLFICEKWSLSGCVRCVVVVERDFVVLFCDEKTDFIFRLYFLPLLLQPLPLRLDLLPRPLPHHKAVDFLNSILNPQSILFLF